MVHALSRRLNALTCMANLMCSLSCPLFPVRATVFEEELKPSLSVA